MNDIMDCIPTRERYLTPEEYSRLTPAEVREFESIEFIPPVLGKENGFGFFHVITKEPIYSFSNGTY